MKRRFRHTFREYAKSFVEIKQTERRWHFPLLAGICVGLCVFTGWLVGKPYFGNIACIGALTILYFTHASLEKRITHLIFCAFGMTLSFIIGLLFSFNPWFSALSLAFVAFQSHLITSYFDIPPPRNFFFIMACAVATNIDHNLGLLPTHVGLFAMGSILAVVLAFLYSVYIAKHVVDIPRMTPRKSRYTKTVESIILAVALGAALLVGYAVDKGSPYWIPVSALAVLQGKDLTHTSQRNLHRIFGTFLGLGLTCFIFSTQPTALALIFILASLQFLTEMMIVRNYLLAAIFITPMTIILAETAGVQYLDIDTLMYSRLVDTIIGSMIGFAAGLFLHNKDVIAFLEKKFRGTKILLKKI